MTCLRDCEACGKVPIEAKRIALAIRTNVPALACQTDLPSRQGQVAQDVGVRNSRTKETLSNQDSQFSGRR